MEAQISRPQGIWRRVICIWLCCSFLWWNLSYAAPQGGTVVAGNASISQSGNSTTINQTTGKAIINWQSFNTSAAEQVRFNQPGISSIALNRINSGLPTMFAGLLSANGQVWIVNPAGVLFTGTSRINVGGLLATTLNIHNNDFMSGNYNFQQVPGFSNGAIVNNGQIIATGGDAAAEGLVALVAPGVENNGVIAANYGKVVLASGTAFTLDLYGDQLISFGTGSKVAEVAVTADGRILKDAVANNGTIQANGGQVLLAANTAAKIVENVISMNGVIEAKTATKGKNGVIILGGDEGTVSIKGEIDASADKVGNGGTIKIKGATTIISGKLKAKGGSESGNGGFVETSGDIIDVNRMQLDVSAPAGSAGTWYLDPYNITVVAGSGVTNNSGPMSFTPTGNGSQIGVDLINDQLNLFNTNVILDTGGVASPGAQAGNLTINAPITQTAGTANLTLLAAGNVAINSAITMPFGSLTINSGAVSANGAVSFAAATTVGGDLTVTATGNITQTAPLTVAGISSFTTDNNVITLTNAGNDFTGAVSLNNTSGAVQLTDTNALILGTSNVAGPFTVIANGAISQAALSSLTANSTANFNANANPITLNNTGNDFVGNVLLNNSGANAASIQDINGITFGLSAIGGDLSITSGGAVHFTGATTTVGGNLSVTANGVIDQTNRLLITGTSTFNTGAFAVTLNHANNDFTGAVEVSNSGPNNVSLRDNNAIILGNLTIGGDLDVFTQGAITQAALTTITANGTSSFNAHAFPITLTNSGNDFVGAISLNAVLGNDAAINDINDLTFDTSIVNGDLTINAGDAVHFNGTMTVGGNLSVTALGQIDQTGALHITGTSDFSADSNAIILTNSGNNFGLGAVSLNNNGASNDISITDMNVLTLSTVTTDGNLTIQSGSALHFNGTTTVGGDLSVLTGGQIDQAMPLLISGDAIIDAGAHTIDLLDVNDFMGSLSLNNTVGFVRVNDINSLVLDTSTVGGPLTITAAGSITQTALGVLTLNGSSNFTAGANVITLDNSGNDFVGAVSLNNSGSNVVTINDSNDLIIGTTTVGDNLDITAAGSVDFNGITTVGGNLNVSANGDIDQTAKILIAGSTILNPGAFAVILNNASNDFGGEVQVTNSGLNDVSLTDANALILGTLNIGGNLIVSTQGAITQAALSTITVNGTSSFNAHPNPITLTNSGNDFIGAVALTTSAGNDVFINDINDLAFGITSVNGDLTAIAGGGVQFQGNVNIGDNLDVTAGGQIDQTAKVVVSGTSNFDAGANAIILTDPNNNFVGAVTLTNSGAANDISLTDLNALTLGTVTTDGNLNLQTGGALHFNGTTTVGGDLDALADGNIDQTMPLLITGNADFDAGAHAILLNNSSNNFMGTVTLSNSGAHNVSISDLDDLFLTALTVGNNLTVNAGGAVHFNGVTTVGNNLFVTAVDAIDQLAELLISGNSNFTTGNDTITLTDANNDFTGGVSLNNSGANVVTITDVNNLRLNASSVGDDLVVNATSINLNGNISAGDEITFNAPVVLNVNTILTATKTFFTSTLNALTAGVQGLTINGDVEFNDVVGSVALKLLNITGTTDINTSNITTTTTQDYGGPVNLLVSTNLTGSVVNFDPPINGNGNDLTITGNAIFDAIDDVDDLLVTGNATFNGLVGNSILVNTIHIQGTSDIATTSIKTSSTQDYDGAVTLNADPTLQGSTITFGSTIDNAQNLIIDADAIFNGQVGGGVALTSLHVTGSSAINGGLVNTIGTQIYDGAVTLGTDTTLLGSTATFNSTVDGGYSLAIGDGGTPTNAVFEDQVGNNDALTSLHVYGATDINTDVINTIGAQTYEGPVTLTANTTLLASMVTFNNTVDGPFSLDIGSLSTVTNALFNGQVGNGTALSSLHVFGTTDVGTNLIKTSGAQTYEDAVTVNASNTEFASNSNTVTFKDTLDGASDILVTGNAEFNNQVGANITLSSLEVTGTSLLNSAADLMNTTGLQTYGGAVTLNATNTHFATVNDTVTFNDKLNGASDVLITGNAIFEDQVGFNTALSSLHVTGTTDMNGGLIKTTGTQTYDGAVTLTDDVILNTASGAANAITFNDTVDAETIGGQSLTVMGNTLFNGIVGGIKKLSSLFITGTTNINTSGINTTGTQEYNGPVNLQVAAINLMGSTVTFDDTVDGSTALTITGNAEFDDQVGFNTALTSLNVTGTSEIDGGLINTTGTQTYGGAVTLSNSATLTTASGALDAITFNSTVDAQTAGVQSLVVNGNTLFNGVVGGIKKLSSLLINGTTNINTTGISTTGTQTYNGPVFLLAANTNLMGSTIIANNIIDNSNNLVVTGNAIFNDSLGATTPLNSLKVTGTTIINPTATLIRTLGNQQYVGAVTLGTTTTLQASTLNFNNTINAQNAGVQGLTINGSPTFDNAIGNVAPLQFLIINGSSTFNGGSVNTTGNQIYNGSLQMNNNLFLNTNGDIVFNAVNGIGKTLTINFAHNVTGFGFINVGNFIQNNGSGTDSFQQPSPPASGIHAGNQINIRTNFIAGGTFNAPTVTLFGTSGVNGIASTNNLFLGGGGGNLILTTVGGGTAKAAADNARLLPGTSGAFFVNGFLVTQIANINNLTQFNNFDEGTICQGSRCAAIQFLSDNNLRLTAGTVFCMMGFAIAEDPEGNERILMPGDKVYVDEKIITDPMSRVKINSEVTGQSIEVGASQQYSFQAENSPADAT